MSEPITITVQKAIRGGRAQQEQNIAFARAFQIPVARPAEKYRMPFNTLEPFLFNPEMDFRANLVYDLPTWPRRESFYVKLANPKCGFPIERRIPEKDIVPVNEETEKFTSLFPKPHLSYTQPEDVQIHLTNEQPHLEHAMGEINAQRVHNREETETNIGPLNLPPNTHLNKEEFMDMSLTVMFPGNLAIYPPQEYPPTPGQVITPEPETQPQKKQRTVAPAQIYTSAEILSRKPTKRDDLEKLKTPGFIMLANLCRAPAEEKASAFRTRRGGYQKKAALIEHADDRFVTTGYRRNAGDFIDESAEAKLREASLKLNALNARNMRSTLKWFQQTIGELLPMSEVVGMLISRTLVDTDFPEKNQHIATLARFCHYMCYDGRFHELLVARTISKYMELASSSLTRVPILQSLLTFVGHMLRETIVSPYHFFWALELVVAKQSARRAVEIIRTGLAVAGEYLEKRGTSEVATFFRFLKDNPVQDGYLRFLVTELLERREGGWHVEETPTPPKPKTAEFDAAALDDFLEQQYRAFVEYKKSKPKPPKGIAIELVLHSIYGALKKHIRDIHEYAAFAAALVENGGADQTEVRRAVQLEHPRFQTVVAEEDNAQLWGLAFVMYGQLFNMHLLSFAEVVGLVRAIPKSGPQPNVATMIARFLSRAKITEADVLEAVAATDLMKDERALALAVAAVPAGRAESLEARVAEIGREARPGLTACGFFVREMMFDLFGTEDAQMRYDERLKPLSKTLELCLQLFPAFTRRVIDDARSQLEIPPSFDREFVEYVNLLAQQAAARAQDADLM